MTDDEAQAAIEALTQAVKDMPVWVPRDLAESFVDPSDCYLDHDGNCQEHNWFGEGECRQARLKRLLEPLSESPLADVDALVDRDMTDEERTAFLDALDDV